MSFEPEVAIFSLSDKFLKLVDQFPFLVSHIATAGQTTKNS